jgi:type II secretory pathway pseudopilin PulG
MTSLSTLARAARLGTPRKRGVTLIEAVLYISIALALIVGGLVFFQQASLAQRTNSAVRNISAVASEVRSLYQQSNSFAGVDEVTLINAGAVPSGIIDNTTDPATLKNEWGGFVQVASAPAVAPFPADSGFTVTYRGVPEAACTRLTSTDASGTARVGSGVRFIAFGLPNAALAGGTAPVDPTTGLPALTPSDVADFCRPDNSTGTVDIMFTFNR